MLKSPVTVAVLSTPPPTIWALLKSPVTVAVLSKPPPIWPSCGRR